MPVEIGRASSLRLIESAGRQGRARAGRHPEGRRHRGARGRGPVQRSASRARSSASSRRPRTASPRCCAASSAAASSDSRRRSPTWSPATNRWSRSARTRSRSTASGMAVYDVAKQLIAISPDIPDETAQVLDQNKDPGRLGDIAAATVDLSPEERASLLVESDVAERLRRLLVLLQRKVELIKVKQKIDPQVREEFSKHQREAVLRQKLKAIQDELGEGEDASDLDAFDEKIKAAEHARGRREDGAQAARAAQADGAVLGRVHRAAHLPRVAGRAAVVEAHRGPARPRSGARDPRRRPLRPREGEEAHPRVPGGAQARAREEGADPLPRRARPASARRRSGKSIARSLGREFIRISLGGVRDEAEDPRPPPHVHRRAAGPHHPGHAPGGHAQPGVHARRDRQAGRRLPRRPVGGAARGARPRAELDVLRPLPRGAFDLSRRHLHRDGEHAGPDPAGAARPHGGAGAPGLHARGEAGDREALPGAEAARRARPRRRARSRFSDEALITIIEQYTREAGVRNLEREICQRHPRASRSRWPRTWPTIRT